MYFTSGSDRAFEQLMQGKPIRHMAQAKMSLIVSMIVSLLNGLILHEKKY